MTDFGPEPGTPEGGGAAGPGGPRSADGIGQPAAPRPWGQAPAPSPFGPENRGPSASPPPPSEGPPSPWTPIGPGAPPGGPPPAYPRQSAAVPALVCSILGLACCLPLGPIGLILGATDLRAIDNGLSDPSKRGTARAAIIIGAVATVLSVGFVLLVVFAGMAAN